MKKTVLYDLHAQHGAKFGPFAGYDMPLFYKSGIIKEHQHTRQNAGLFDISHMMLVNLAGADAAKAISRLCPLLADEIPVGDARYTFFLNEQGGIIDDLIVSRLGTDRYSMVCNAGCAEKDWDHINAHTGAFDVQASIVPYGLIALQGPKAVGVLEGMGLSVSEMQFMQVAEIGSDSEKWLVSRSGYTGEDGFELAMPEAELPAFAEQLLDHGDVMPIGLGARDSLRLEAGLSLYGQDLSDTISPMEAGLTWAIPKALRDGGPYIGSDAIVEKRAAGRPRKRVGLIPEGRAPVRAGSIIRDQSGAQVGMVTSGGFGPTVEHPVALGLIDANADSEGLVAEVRSKLIPLQIARLPFAPHNYKR